MTVQAAIDQRIEKIRLPSWAEDAHVSFDLLDAGRYGPWAHVKDHSGETDILLPDLLRDSSEEWEEYKENV